MKLRLHDDVVRLRLTPSEIDRLAATGRLTATVHIASDCAFTYALETADADTLCATLADHMLIISVPRAWVPPWAEGERIGFESMQHAGDGHVLTILVERDLGCEHDTPSHPRRRATDAG